LFLFLVAFVLFQNNFLPAIFLQAMGIFQLVTALIWWAGIYLLRKKLV
jgi:F0F1-type ATP synthase membrane subunit c/vacuolar-type H+-ATPase subunit K